jgi:hypothetical protein
MCVRVAIFSHTFWPRLLQNEVSSGTSRKARNVKLALSAIQATHFTAHNCPCKQSRYVSLVPAYRAIDDDVRQRSPSSSRQHAYGTRLRRPPRGDHALRVPRPSTGTEGPKPRRLAELVLVVPANADTNADAHPRPVSCTDTLAVADPDAGAHGDADAIADQCFSDGVENSGGHAVGYTNVHATGEPVDKCETDPVVLAPGDAVGVAEAHEFSMWRSPRRAQGDRRHERN